MRVIVGGSYWTLNGVNVFSENLVRGLRAKGFAAEILLTEEDTQLITINDAAMPRRGDVLMTALPVPRSGSWGRHWGAMVRYLEDRAPCVYIPNSDWRHSSVGPLLSSGVRMVGVVHSDDPLHYDHVRRLGPYWDAIVATSPFIARKTIRQDPGVEARTQVIPIGVTIPQTLPERDRGYGRPLRVIYPGTLKQHQKRVLDLPKIVEAAHQRDVNMTLTIAGGGPDEAVLKEACASLVERGLVTFLGVVPHDAVLDLMEAHDVFILTSEFEGLPNALLEAMGRGCVPVVTDIESGIPDVVKDGVSGCLVPVGDIAAFVDRLEHLGHDEDRWRRMSVAAHAAVLAGRFRLEDMVESYASLFMRLHDRGDWPRPAGVLNHPPAEVGGVGLFPLDLPYDEPGVGAFPSWLPDTREFLDEVSHLHHPERSPLNLLLRRRAAAHRGLEGVRVIISTPTWVPNGLNDYFASIVRGLNAAGVDARLLLTETGTDLVQTGAGEERVPADVPHDRLPVGRSEGWGAHWGAMVRYLEDLAPCVYMPGYDWRHSVVAPLLSDGVTIVGLVPGWNDPLHLDHVQRLGPFWDAVVATETGTARALGEMASVATRVHTITSQGPDVGLDYLELFSHLLADRGAVAYRRPSGALLSPPSVVAGVDIFPESVSIDASPLAIRDVREFRTHIRAMRESNRSPLSRGMPSEDVGFDRLTGVRVIVGLPVWQSGGVEEWSARLVRSLADHGADARLLLTEEDTELVSPPSAAAAPVPDVQIDRLPVGRTDGWQEHWNGMIRYLEAHAPCIYIPNHDWRHACVAPVLSDTVMILGVLHGNDAMHLDHATHFGRFWNAVVTYDATVARTISLDPHLSSRVFVLPFATPDPARDFLDVIDRILDDAASGRFRRPAGPLQPPPRILGGVEVFSSDY